MSFFSLSLSLFLRLSLSLSLPLSLALSLSLSLSLSLPPQNKKHQEQTPHALVARGRARDGQGVALEADLGAVVEPLRGEVKSRYFLGFFGEQNRKKILSKEIEKIRERQLRVGRSGGRKKKKRETVRLPLEALAEKKKNVALKRARQAARKKKMPCAPIQRAL